MNKHLLYYLLYWFIGANLDFYLWRKYSCNTYFVGIIFGCLMTLSIKNYFDSITEKRIAKELESILAEMDEQGVDDIRNLDRK